MPQWKQNLQIMCCRKETELHSVIGSPTLPRTKNKKVSEILSN
jgi:hypothetical protein